MLLPIIGLPVPLFIPFGCDEDDDKENAPKESYDNWDDCEIAQTKHNRKVWLTVILIYIIVVFVIVLYYIKNK